MTTYEESEQVVRMWLGCRQAGTRGLQAHQQQNRGQCRDELTKGGVTKGNTTRQLERDKINGDEMHTYWPSDQ